MTDTMRDTMNNYIGKGVNCLFYTGELFISNISTIAIQGLFSFLIYLLIKYRFKGTETSELRLKKKTVDRLIEEFQPLPLVEKQTIEQKEIPNIKENFCNYDVFNLGGKFKPEIQKTIERYGIGTCGPRGFYGTLDIHIELEKKLCSIFNTESVILYSNHFTCLQSVVHCFCQSKNTVYFYRYASEAILRGLYESKAGTIMYESLDDLESKIDKKIPDKYVIAERVCKNTGELLDMNRLVELRKKYGFRIILDESFSVPFLYQNWKGSSEINKIFNRKATKIVNKETNKVVSKETNVVFNKKTNKVVNKETNKISNTTNNKSMLNTNLTNNIILTNNSTNDTILNTNTTNNTILTNNSTNIYNSIDVIIGSLCHGYPGNGAFSAGAFDVTEYQRLNGNGYVFSASLPAFLTTAAKYFVDQQIDYKRIQNKVRSAYEIFRKNGINYVSMINNKDNSLNIDDILSPIILINCKNAFYLQNELKSRGYLTGVNGYKLRICINEKISEESLNELSKLIKEIDK